MSTLQLVSGEWRYHADLSQVIDLSLKVRFDHASDQPSVNAFGASAPHATPLQVGNFVGDVHQGGSCNCQQLHFTPHCHGTHTESVAHITREPYAVAQLARGIYVAQLISLPTNIEVITLDELQRVLPSLHLREHAIGAVIVRTRIANPALPYIPNTPAYFQPAALAWLAAQGIEHVLIDTPSVDHMNDATLLAHRAFWGLPAGSQALADATRPQATITELIQVPTNVSDGLYLLNLNIAPIDGDAAPSRPLIYPATCSRV